MYKKTINRNIIIKLLDTQAITKYLNILSKLLRSNLLSKNIIDIREKLWISSPIQIKDNWLLLIIQIELRKKIKKEKREWKLLFKITIIIILFSELKIINNKKNKNNWLINFLWVNKKFIHIYDPHQ